MFTKEDERQLGIWERKVLRRIFGPVNENDNWRIRTNKELHNLYQDIDLVTLIKTQRIKWLGHVNRMQNCRKPKRALEGKPGGKRKRGIPHLRRLDRVECNLGKLEGRRWRR